MSFANSEILPQLSAWFRPLIGRDPFNKKTVEDSQKATLKAMSVLEEHLLVNTFLVGERITLADLFATSVASRGFQFVFDKKWRTEYPNVTRWYETIYNQPIYSAVVDKLSFIDEAIPNHPPKKEKEEKPKKEQAPKAAPKPKAKEVDEEEEEEDKPQPKPKHPLEALPKPTLVLDDWKRKYSNEETREVALPWFWENFNAEEYSIWRVDYKYNDELTMTFMTSNLIGESPLFFSPPMRDGLVSGHNERRYQANERSVCPLFDNNPGDTSKLNLVLSHLLDLEPLKPPISTIDIL